VTHLELCDALREAGFRVVAARPALVVADRGIPGMPRAFRVCGASQVADGPWTVRVRVTEPGIGLARVERDVHERRDLTERDAFEYWLGGVCSLPAGEGERIAIGPAAPGVRQCVAWTAGHGWTEWHVLAEFHPGVDRNHYRTVCGRTEPHAPFARDRYRETALRPLGTCLTCWPQDEPRVGEPVTASATA
jgi:hypothetical protein